MALLSTNDIEAELSYAYLHAVAAKAKMSCECTGRHTDNAGVDARIHAVEKFAADSVLTDFPVYVQLKATSQEPAQQKGKLSYFMKDIGRYDRLRNSGANPPRILVVLFLPCDAVDWITQTEDQLAMKKCAYWVSLRGAAESENRTGVTVYLPTRQIFSPNELLDLMTRISRQEELFYEH
jgi:hypothetical protein